MPSGVQQASILETDVEPRQVLLNIHRVRANRRQRRHASTNVNVAAALEATTAS